MMENKECVMCGGDAGKFGNNPAPLYYEGVCCDECNIQVVSFRIMISQIPG